MIFPIVAPESHVENCGVFFAMEQMVRKRAPVRLAFSKIARSVLQGIQMKNAHVILRLQAAPIVDTMKEAFPALTTRMKMGTLCVRETTEAGVEQELLVDRGVA